MKVCFRCKEEKTLDNFTKDKQSKDGLRSTCRSCILQMGRDWRAKNKDKVHAYFNGEQRKQWHNEYRRGRKAERAEEARKYRAKLGDEYRERRRKYWEKNKERLLEYRAEYIKDHPWFNRAASSRHRALILQRTPPWADLEAIKKVFRECPKDMVVDHIVPLRGRQVSGLHVSYNLQYLTPEENGKKSNKLVNYE